MIFSFFHIACTQEEEGRVNGSLIISQRNEICRIVMNYTTIEVCDNGGWREICDANFTQEDAQVICRELEFSAIGKLAHLLLYFVRLKTTRLPGMIVILL